MGLDGLGGVLLSVGLRPRSEEGAVKPLRCWVTLHSWEKVSSEDGTGRFRRCRRCGKHDYPSDRSGGNWASGTFG